ncbi:hypothetical protein N177_0090 [Lutibaculum baratangense AMV1]|uniref:Uncharacterized protein n=1 Tax=Lutibaculum baratangense AMV1 TaxID=631454 RepID=V4RN38_9HYPH|nr:hypothetical protein N177_0090 [Lutibaculum baratangense AMV1]
MHLRSPQILEPARPPAQRSRNDRVRRRLESGRRGGGRCARD